MVSKFGNDNTYEGRLFKVPYSPRGSVFGREELEQLEQLLLGSDVTLSCGIWRERFENEFRDTIGTKYAFAVSNGSVALDLAFQLLDLNPQDEVIATPQTYQATVQPLLTHDGHVRFCDIDPNSLCADTSSIESLINERTRAIVLTHYGGLTADMGPIVDLAHSRGIVVIEDCAHAIGSTYLGVPAGALGDIGCFSFQSMKNISTLGEGGMLTTNNDEWAERLRRIRANEPDAVFRDRPTVFGDYAPPVRDLNRHAKNSYTQECHEVRLPGTNATLSEPAAAVGCVQLRKLERLNARRRQIAAHISSSIKEVPGLSTQEPPPGFHHTYHLYTLFVTDEVDYDREALAMALEDAGIEIHLRYFPIHLLPEWRYRGHSFGECPIAEKTWFEQHINLPIYPSMTDDQVEFMVSAVREASQRLVRC